MTAGELTKIIKDKALKFGFSDCGISKADFLEEEAPRLENYLKKNYHGEMTFLENHFDKRLDPRLLVEGCKSVISLKYNYYPENKIVAENSTFKIAKYAYGEDYHEVVKSVLREMVVELQEEIGEFSFRIFTDSAPVMEKAWARKSGLGWIGKNSLLVSKKGSFFVLSEIICDLELEYDSGIKDFCGTCRKCIDACPTGAIVDSKIINGSKCISYATIELRGEIPDYFNGKLENWMFGCDICQDVCPWNRFSLAHNEPRFSPNEHLQNFDTIEWKDITQELFSEIFRKSAVKRTKLAGLKRNISFINNGIKNIKNKEE